MQLLPGTCPNHCLHITHLTQLLLSDSGYSYGFRGRTQASLIDLLFKSIWKELSGGWGTIFFFILGTKTTVISKTIKIVPWGLQILTIYRCGDVGSMMTEAYSK